MKFEKIFLPTIVGISVYLLVSKFFPEKLSNKNSQKDFRGGNLIPNSTIEKILKRIMQDRALKIALISVFFTAGYQHFNQEVETLLVDEVFQQVCSSTGEGKLTIVCDIIKEHDLNLHTKSIKELIVTNNLSTEAKINLLKIKLDFIINGECGGKKRFIILSIVAILLTLFESGLLGLGIFLEALYRLFQEGKISRAVYNEILKIVSKRWTKVPIDHLR